LKVSFFLLSFKDNKKMSAVRCAPFWLNSPNILWEDARDFYPFNPMAQKCTSTALNSLTRFGIYLAIVLCLTTFNIVYINIAVGIAIVSVAAYFGMKGQGSLREGFEDAKKEIVSPTLFRIMKTDNSNIIGGIDVQGKPVDDVIGKTDRTLPTGPNPFMNLLVNEYKDNPQKPSAKNVNTPEMSRELSDQFQTNMYNDPNDVFQHTQSQRTWVVQPITSIPNDRESYQNWLYRTPGRTCKEGNNAVCQTATEGSPVTWLMAN
jgi:hypothetical protein